MFSPESDAHYALLISLGTGLLAIPPLVIYIWGILISRTTARRTTEPILILQILSPICRGYVELKNIGAVPATGIRVELIEKRRRASASLQASGDLAKDESCSILALDYPNELIKESDEQQLIPDATLSSFRFNRIKDNALNAAEIPLDKIEIDILARQIAFYLMTRQGGQRIIVSCAIPDKPRQHRIYKVRRSDSVNSEFQMYCTFLARYRAAYLRFRYKKNAVLRPIPEMPEFLKIDSEEP